MLLYYFDGPEDLLAQAVVKLRDRRVVNAPAAADLARPQTLAARVLAAWPSPGRRVTVLAQANGLMLSDRPVRRAGRERLAAVHAGTVSLCPPDWPERRKLEVAEMIMATLQGFASAC